jgi:hypothetical protein
VTDGDVPRTAGAGDERHDILRRGDLSPVGRIRSASNATFLCEATLGETTVAKSKHPNVLYHIRVS